MILYINTKDQKSIEVKLKKDAKIIDQLSDQNEWGSQVLLPLIQKLLKKNSLEFKDLKAIEVETGPGSFTGLKVGVAVANALAFSLKIPVNNKEIETDLIYT
ncbi:tRNA (adenosine(37)-N6)-threonylcarbamoyltransferase complex dimerization subunit type 1 TsaB [Candidatus Daviesbacteria bacterium]|nr:tRNA (adenosine(37)-N6)-threonylcarbamoyltransferase complex dimerization subunit type 1 TsaB [Candidatus Daviesbacteria bacterium]